MKKSISPSAETVGLSSGKSELMLIPRFSTLIMVEEVMIFSFCCFRAPVSCKGCAKELTNSRRAKGKMNFFKRSDLDT